VPENKGSFFDVIGPVREFIQDADRGYRRIVFID